MAALKRAVQVLGGPTIEGIPEDQPDTLWELCKLYARDVKIGDQDRPKLDDAVEATVDGGSYRTTPSSTIQGHPVRLWEGSTAEMNVWRYSKTYRVE